MNRTVDALIIPYARRRTLELVLSLSGYEADKDAYLEAKGILERAVAALDDGRDPADNIERIDGQACGTVKGEEDGLYEWIL